MNRGDPCFGKTEIPFRVPKTFFAAETVAVFGGHVLSTLPRVADQVPDAPASLFIASAAQGDPEAPWRACTIMNAPEVAPPGVTRKAERVELAPLAIVFHLDVPLDADDVPDAQRIEQGEQVHIGKATIRRQPHSLRRNVIKPP